MLRRQLDEGVEQQISSNDNAILGEKTFVDPRQMELSRVLNTDSVM